ncbi:MAG TPA: TetR/AcrR family transcriptional regulator [bacterium]|nr:TetR/AcrR family transcriptional regulator [bacterium]
MGRHKGYDRTEVLEKAMHLFWRKGFEGAHLQELVAVTGLNRFSLYKEFGGKEGLYEAAVEHYLLGLQHLGAILNREPLGLQNVLDEVQLVIETEFPYGCFMTNALTQQEVLDAKIRRRVQNHIAQTEALILRNFEAAQGRGEIPADRDLAGLAKFVVTFDIGIVTYATTRPTPQEKRQIWESFRDLLTRSLSAEPRGEALPPASEAG